MCKDVGLRCKQNIPLPTLPTSATEARNALALLRFVICHDYSPSNPVLHYDVILRSVSQHGYLLIWKAICRATLSSWGLLKQWFRFKQLTAVTRHSWDNISFLLTEFRFLRKCWHEILLTETRVFFMLVKKFIQYNYIPLLDTISDLFKAFDTAVVVRHNPNRP